VNIDTLVLVSVLAFLVWLLLSVSTITKIIDMRRTPTTWISGLPSEGRVEVMGLAGQKILETPINKSPCVLWQLEVQEEKKITSWITVHKESSSESFEIFDETGKIRINPAGADLVLEDDYPAHDVNPITTSVLAGFGVSTTNWLGFDKNLRVFERWIAPKEQVCVIGEIQYFEGQKSIGGNSHKLIISDQDECDTLSTLFKKLAINALIVFGGAIAFFLGFTGKI
jgi:E3 Ubiquitin ligase